VPHMCIVFYAGAAQSTKRIFGLGSGATLRRFPKALVSCSLEQGIRVSLYREREPRLPKAVHAAELQPAKTVMFPGVK